MISSISLDVEMHVTFVFVKIGGEEKTACGGLPLKDEYWSEDQAYATTRDFDRNRYRW